MADAAITESITPSPEKPQSSKAKNFADWLKRFGRKGHSTGQVTELNNTQAPEERPQKSVNELLRVKEADQLKKAEPILFHTAPNEHLDEIKTQGLYSQATDPNLGDNIGYSLFFAAEHQLRSKGSKAGIQQARKNTPENYSLTIWRKSEYIRKDAGKDSMNWGFYAPSKIPDEGVSLGDYLDAAYRGNMDYHFFGEIAGKIMIRENARNVPPEFLLGIVTLNQQVRDRIVDNMALSKAGMVSADQVEESFRQLFSNHLVYRNIEIDPNSLAHNLTASIEQNLIRNTVMPEIGLLRSQRMGDSELLKSALLQSMFLRTKVNDQVSAKYLDLAIKWLVEEIAKTSLGEDLFTKDFANQILAFDQNPKGSPQILKIANIHKYYGSNEAQYIAEEILKEHLENPKPPSF